MNYSFLVHVLGVHLRSFVCLFCFFFGGGGGGEKELFFHFRTYMSSLIES